MYKFLPVLCTLERIKQLLIFNSPPCLLPTAADMEGKRDLFVLPLDVSPDAKGPRKSPVITQYYWDGLPFLEPENRTLELWDRSYNISLQLYPPDNRGRPIWVNIRRDESAEGPRLTTKLLSRRSYIALQNELQRRIADELAPILRRVPHDVATYMVATQFSVQELLNAAVALHGTTLGRAIRRDRAWQLRLDREYPYMRLVMGALRAIGSPNEMIQTPELQQVAQMVQQHVDTEKLEQALVQAFQANPAASEYDGLPRWFYTPIRNGTRVVRPEDPDTNPYPPWMRWYLWARVLISECFPLYDYESGEVLFHSQKGLYRNVYTTMDRIEAFNIIMSTDLWWRDREKFWNNVLARGLKNITDFPINPVLIKGDNAPPGSTVWFDLDEVLDHIKDVYVDTTVKLDVKPASDRIFFEFLNIPIRIGAADRATMDVSFRWQSYNGRYTYQYVFWPGPTANEIVLKGLGMYLSESEAENFRRPQRIVNPTLQSDVRAAALIAEFFNMYLDYTLFSGIALSYYFSHHDYKTEKWIPSLMQLYREGKAPRPQHTKIIEALQTKYATEPPRATRNGKSVLYLGCQACGSPTVTTQCAGCGAQCCGGRQCDAKHKEQCGRGE